jgi:hypothetical protein
MDERRAGYYAENLLLYTKQAQGEGKLPIPIDEHHKFAPVRIFIGPHRLIHSLTPIAP